MIEYKKNKILVDIYDNISELYNWCKNTPRRAGADNSSESGGYGFTHTRSLEEAYESMIYGDEELYKQIREEKRKIDIDKILGNAIKGQKEIQDVVGYQVNVANYLLGIPTDMINKEATKKSQKIINIIVNSTVSAGVRTSDIIKAGIYYITTIDLLEKIGYRCNLYAMSNFSSDGEIGMSMVKIKTDREPFNIKKLAFVLANPSFQRRINFKWTESCNCDTEPTHNFYGRPLTDNSEIKKILKDFTKIDFISWSLQDDVKCEINMNKIIENLKADGIRIGDEKNG